MGRGQEELARGEPSAALFRAAPASSAGAGGGGPVRPPGSHSLPGWRGHPGAGAAGRGRAASLLLQP